jgi:hypothetical protein
MKSSLLKNRPPQGGEGATNSFLKPESEEPSLSSKGIVAQLVSGGGCRDNGS